MQPGGVRLPPSPLQPPQEGELRPSQLIASLGSPPWAGAPRCQVGTVWAAWDAPVLLLGHDEGG